jgi:hypothetical protein
MQRSIVSWVEVVLVTSIAALVVGVGLGLTGRIRDAADRAKCQNNLKELSFALASYYDQNGTLPPLTDQGEGAPTGWGLPSIFAHLILYMEQTPFYFRSEWPPDHYHAHSSVVFNYSHKSAVTQVGGVANSVMRVFLDPADDTSDRLIDVPMTLPDGSTGYYATGSYAANGLIPWGMRFPPEGWSRTIGNALLFGERVQVCRTASGGDVYNLWGLGIYSPHMPAFATLKPADLPGLISTGQVAPDRPLPDEGAADQIRLRVGRRDAPLESLDIWPVQIVRRGRPCDPRLPGSPHAAGMQAVMGDGSVRLFHPDTSPWVFWAACMPAQPLGD